MPVNGLVLIAHLQSLCEILRAYSSWDSMKQRCTNPNNARVEKLRRKGYNIHGRLGTFEGFYKDMGERPIGLSLERVNVNGNLLQGKIVFGLLHNNK